MRKYLDVTYKNTISGYKKCKCKKRSVEFCVISYPAGNCMFKVNNRNTRTRCEICSKLTIKTPERR